MRLVIMGSTLQTRYCLEELLRNKNYEILAVFALDEKTRFEEGGYTTRVRGVTFFDLVKKYGFELHLGSMKKPENVDIIKRLNPDLILAPGSSEIIPGDILNIPRLGSIGSHGALLPYVKGGASMNWALACGNERWGISLFYLTEEVDEGSIVGVKEFNVYDQDDINTLHHRADLFTVDLIKELLPSIGDGSLKPYVDNVETVKLGKRKLMKKGEWDWRRIVEWNNGIIEQYRKRDRNKRIYLPSRIPGDEIIDWDKPTKEIYNWIRAFTHPFHGAFTFLGKNKIHIWSSEKIDVNEGFDPGTIYHVSEQMVSVSTVDGSLLIKRVQYENEPEMLAREFYERHNIKIGHCFSTYPK